MKEIIIKMIIHSEDNQMTIHKRMNPACICYSKYDSESKTFRDFEGCFDSSNNPELCREFKKGYYLIWVYVLYDNCKASSSRFKK